MRLIFLQNFIDVLRGKKVYAKFLKKKYDAVFSLGNNCETCIRLRDDFLGADFESFLFNWTAILDRDKFIELLGTGGKKLLCDNFEYTNSNDMLYAKYFKIGIHSRYKKEELADNLKLQKEAVDEIKSRLNHLAEKTEILFNSNKSILFVAKVLHKDFEDDCNYIKNLYNIILKNITYSDKRNFKLLCIVQKYDYDDKKFKKLCLKFKNFQKNRLEIKRVKKFANLGMKKGDRYGWVKILKKEIFV